MSFKPLLPSLALSLFLGMPISDATASEVDAAGYYELRCATCHGVNGEGTRDKSPSLGPPLRGNPLVINAPAEMLASIIRHGRGGQQRTYDDAYPNMPAFDAGLVPDAVGLATYLKTVLQQQEKTSHNSDSAGWQAPARVVAAESTEDGAGIHEAAPDRARADESRLQTQLVGPVHQSSLHLTE
jgi:mono/diheme cytochrome c family protein